MSSKQYVKANNLHREREREREREWVYITRMAYD